MKNNAKQILAWILVLVMLLSTVSLAACGQSGPVTITVENGMGGGEYDVGDEVTVTAIVPNGQTFVNWTVKGEEVSKENPYTFKAKKSITITANLQGGQSGDALGGEELTGNWADAVLDENLEVTINWWRLQPIYFVGDTLLVSEYPVESFTDERANEVDDYETLLRIAKEGGAEELVSNAEGYTFTEAGKYTLYRYALKDDKYAKSKGYEINVIAPDGTAPDGVELHNAAVVGSQYVLKRSTVNGSMGNILEGTADFSYAAFTKEGGYGPGTWVTVTFTGKNRPNIGMFFDADNTLLGGKTGFIAGDFATYSEVGSQTFLRRLTVFDYASIGAAGDIISNPVRPATYSGGLDGVNDLPCAWSMLDDSKTYEYVVGTWTEPISGSEKSKLVLSIELYEVGADGAKTSVYKQNRDISNNGQYDYANQTGDIVLLGSNKKEIEFSAAITVKDAHTASGSVTSDKPSSGGSNNGAGSGTVGSVVPFEGGVLYNATANGTTYTLKQSMVKGSMGNILKGTANFSYVAFTQPGGYSPGASISVTFKGKNRPNVGMFFTAKRTLLGGTTGFILGDFAAPNGGNQTYLRRLTVFDYASIGKTGDLIANPVRPANFTGANGVNDLPPAWSSLDSSKTYEYIVSSRTEPIGSTGKSRLLVRVELYELGADGAKTLIYNQERDISNNGQYDYANQTGDIVLLGSNMKDITFTATVSADGSQPGTGGGSVGKDDETVSFAGGELYKGTVTGTDFTLAQSVVNGSMGNISGGTADFSYAAFTKEGGYGPGTWVSMSFTGKNRPNVGMFFDANSTLLGGETGFILGDFAAPNGSQTFLNRLTVFDYANIGSTGDLISNPLRPANFTGASGVNDLPCAWNSLDDTKSYEYIVGSWTEGIEGTEKSKLVVMVQLYQVGADGIKTLVYSQERDITNNGQYDYANQTGDIVLLGSNMKDITFSARILTQEEADAIRFALCKVSVTNGTINGKASDTIKQGQKATVIANAPATGKRFVKWVDGSGAEVSKAATYEFTVNGDIALTAVYADVEKWTVTVVGGTIDGAASKQIDSGTSVTVVAGTPPTGKVFACWKIGADVVSTQSSYTFTPEASLTITAVFETAPAAGTMATNKAQKNSDGTYTIQKSGLTAANRENIYGNGANLDWGYVAFRGDYGAGTMVSVTFTGKNRPSFGFGHDATSTFDATTGFILGGSTSGGVSGTKGRLTIFNMNSIHTSGKLISTPNRITYTGTPLDSSVTATTSTDSIAPAFDYLDPNKTYEFVVGTWLEDLNAAAGTKKFMVNVILFEIAEDGTKTCIYQQSRDANDNGKWAYENTLGDVVLYGAFDANITFSAKLIKDSAEIKKYNAVRKGNVWEP